MTKKIRSKERMLKTDGGLLSCWRHARLLDHCEAKEDRMGKASAMVESVLTLEEQPWKNEELRKLEEVLPRFKRVIGKR